MDAVLLLLALLASALCAAVALAAVATVTMLLLREEPSLELAIDDDTFFDPDEPVHCIAPRAVVGPKRVIPTRGFAERVHLKTIAAVLCGRAALAYRTGHVHALLDLRLDPILMNMAAEGLLEPYQEAMLHLEAEEADVDEALDGLQVAEHYGWALGWIDHVAIEPHTRLPHAPTWSATVAAAQVATLRRLDVLEKGRHDAMVAASYGLWAHVEDSAASARLVAATWLVERESLVGAARLVREELLAVAPTRVA